MWVKIFAGTHGNEFCGIWLFRQWQANPARFARPGLDIDFTLANPNAFKLGRRYQDEDLNRCFNKNLTTKDVKRPSSSPKQSYEAGRANELTKLLQSATGSGFAIDLHTTTANMGLTLVLAKTTTLSAWVAKKVQERLPQTRILTTHQSDSSSPMLVNACQEGLIIEVGPVAQNIYHPTIVAILEKACQTILDVLQQINNGDAIEFPFTLDTWQEYKDIAFPRDTEGAISAMIHPQLQDRDYHLLTAGAPLFLTRDQKELCLELTGEFYPVFINEASYYEKDLAFTLCKRVRKSFQA